jgi:hypothetical protein
MKAIIEYEIGDLWATPQQLAEMSDAEIVELLREDTSELMDGAQWRIERGTDPNTAPCPACVGKRLHSAEEWAALEIRLSNTLMALRQVSSAYCDASEHQNEWLAVDKVLAAEIGFTEPCTRSAEKEKS